MRTEERRAEVRLKMYYAKIIHEVAQHECSLEVDESFLE